MDMWYTRQKIDKGIYRESLMGDEGHFVEWSVPDALWDLPGGVGESDNIVVDSTYMGEVLDTHVGGWLG